MTASRSVAGGLSKGQHAHGGGARANDARAVGGDGRARHRRRAGDPVTDRFVRAARATSGFETADGTSGFASWLNIVSLWTLRVPVHRAWKDDDAERRTACARFA